MATLFFQWGRCYSGFVTPLYGALLAATPAERDQDHLQTIIWSDPTVPDRTEAIVSGGADPTPMLIAGARRLDEFGVDIIAMPCNTAHAFLPAIQASVPVPILSMIESTGDAVKRSSPGVARAGLIATNGTIQSGLYAVELARLGIELTLPTDTEQSLVMDAIHSIKAGQLGPTVANQLRDMAARLSARGAEILIAGCSEVLLALPTADMDLKVVDPVQALIGRLLRMAGIRPLPTLNGEEAGWN